MDSIGEMFYKNFFCRFQTFVDRDRRKYEATKSDKDWTKYVIKGFLSALAEDLGFDSVKSESIHAIDLTWRKSSDKTFVAIEHEGAVSSIWDNEVLNLLMAAAQLKVLITYVDDAQFPGEEIAHRLFGILKEKEFKDEFLLILGAESMWEPTDWAGYLYKPELAIKTLVCCSQKVFVEGTPGRKAWARRKRKA